MKMKTTKLIIATIVAYFLFLGVLPVHAQDGGDEIENADVLFIQNVTTTGSNSYNADYIKVGTNVTNEIPPGDVTLGGSQVTLTGKRVILNGSTTVPLGTQLTINP